MNRLRSLPALWVLAVVGVAAAACGHAITSLLTAHGPINGSYATYGHEATLRTAFAAIIILATTAIVALGEGLWKARDDDDWFVQLVQRLAAIPPLGAFAFVYGCQLAVLVALEHGEQVLAFGRALPLADSLGAPLLIGLTVHALCAVLACVVAIRAARTLAAARHQIFARIQPLVVRLLRGSAQPARQVVRVRAVGVETALAPVPVLARHIANRPPPVSAPLV